LRCHLGDNRRHGRRESGAVAARNALGRIAWRRPAGAGGGRIRRSGRARQRLRLPQRRAGRRLARRARRASTFTGIPAGGWFGEGSLLKTEPRRYDVVALRESRIARVPRRTFEWLVNTSIPFNRFLLVQLNERLGQFIGMLESQRLHDPDARVARCVAGLFNTILYPGIDKKLEVSQEEIGYLAGISRQRVNQALHALEAAGLLKVEYGAIVIIDLDGLRRYGS
jgi:CRP/FNR family cyclic AMP-dependent transcriptional regulator